MRKTSEPADRPLVVSIEIIADSQSPSEAVKEDAYHWYGDLVTTQGGKAQPEIGHYQGLSDGLNKL